MQLSSNASLASFIRKNLEVRTSICEGSVKRDLQHFLSLKPNNSYKFEYENLIKFSLSAEKSCPGCGLIFLKAIAGHCVEDLTTPRNKSELVDLLERRGYSSRIRDMLVVALDYSSTSTKLSIRKSSTLSAYLEITEGYSFNASPLFRFQPVEMKEALVLCIDGFVESISEIHHLLEDLSARKKPCIILARGMADDVIHTLKINYDRKTLLIVPFAVPFDVDNVNTLVDIAVVSGNDVISSLKGNLISTIDASKFRNVESCLASDSGLRIKNRGTKASVKDHVNHMKNSIEERPELSEILGKRMRSLSTSCIDFFVPEDINYLSSSQQLDEGIRIISSVLNGSYNPKSTVDAIVESFKRTTADMQIFTSPKK